MNKTIKTLSRALFWYALFDAFILGYAGFLPGVQMAGAQTILTQTTLASAVTSSSTTAIQLTSTSGVTATSTVLFVADSANPEAMFVNAVGTGGFVSVTRGYNGIPGAAAPHVSGALVFVGSPTAFLYSAPAGSCTRANVPFLPAISFNNTGGPPMISDCVGGYWVSSLFTNPSTTPFRVVTPNSGGTAYTSLNTNGTTLVAGTLYCVEADLPVSKRLTGIGVMNGTTVGTDKHLAVLLDSAGNVLANSALAGATTSGASTYQTFAFTTPYYAVGPAQYYACAQSNGTTDTIRMVVTGTQDTYLTTSKTGTFGTIPTITVPTTFTTAVGPYSYLY